MLTATTLAIVDNLLGFRVLSKLIDDILIAAEEDSSGADIPEWIPTTIVWVLLALCEGGVVAGYMRHRQPEPVAIDYDGSIVIEDPETSDSDALFYDVHIDETAGLTEALGEVTKALDLLHDENQFAMATLREAIAKLGSIPADTALPESFAYQEPAPTTYTQPLTVESQEFANVGELLRFLELLQKENALVAVDSGALQPPSSSYGVVSSMTAPEPGKGYDQFTTYAATPPDSSENEEEHLGLLENPPADAGPSPIGSPSSSAGSFESTFFETEDVVETRPATPPGEPTRRSPPPAEPANRDGRSGTVFGQF